MKDYSAYKSFDLQQWLEDTDFLHWVKQPDARPEAFFGYLLEEDAEASQKMKIAIEILQNMNEPEPDFTDQEMQRMWNKIADDTIHQQNTHKKKLFWRKSYIAGAAVILMAALSVLFIYKKRGSSPYFSLADKINIQAFHETNLLLPAKGNFTLADKMRVELNADGKVCLRSAQGEVISLQREIASEEEMGALVVPKGKRASLVLQDGTKMEIRPGSKVIFPLKFAKKKREILIEGEAFFEVSKNKHWPFLVRTRKMEVEVLGTSFNVNAYSQEKEQSVVLVSGSVKVNINGQNGVRIKPNQKYTLEEQGKMGSVENVDVAPYTCWKDGYMLFNSESLSTVLEKLENYYGIALRYKPELLKGIRLSGKLDLNSSVEHALKIISTTTPIIFKPQKTYIEIDVEPQKRKFMQD